MVKYELFKDHFFFLRSTPLLSRNGCCQYSLWQYIIYILPIFTLLKFASIQKRVLNTSIYSYYFVRLFNILFTLQDTVSSDKIFYFSRFFYFNIISFRIIFFVAQKAIVIKIYDFALLMIMISVYI